MTTRQSMHQAGNGTRRGAGRAAARRTAGAALARRHLARGGFGSADRHRSDPSRPVPDRVPDDPDDRLAVPAAGDRGVRPRAGGAGHPRRHLTFSRLAAAAGAGFALATLGGYLLSAWTGLFGFKEVRTGAGIAAGLVEVAAFVVLAALALAPAPATAAADRAATAPARFPAQIPPAAARAAGTAAAGLTVAALVLFGLVVAGASPPPPAATGSGTGTALKTTTIGGTTVLTNANGCTLYSFAPDTPATSNVLRQLRRVLAPGNRHHRGRARPARHGHHHHPDRRLTPAHLQRAPAVHLHRRFGPRPGPGQQPQPQRRALARSARLPVREPLPAYLRRKGHGIRARRT